MAELRRRPLSLRARLVTGVMGVAAIGVAITGVATYAALDRFLSKRIDQQLDASRSPLLIELSRGEPIPGGVRPSSGKTVIPPGTYGELRKFGGQTVKYTRPDQPEPALPARTTDAEGYVTVGATGGDLEYRVLVTPLSDGSVLVVALPLDSVRQTLARLVRIELVVAVVVMALAALLATWVVRVGLRPLDEIAATAGEIAGGELDRRVEPAEPSTEVGRLGLALNAMLGRIEEAFAERRASEDRLRRFVADASHELRTPLTSIRGYAEMFRRGISERPEDLAVAMRRIEDEATRMGGLVDDLLLLARLDQGRPLERERVDLAALAADAVSDLHAVEPDRPVTVDAAEPVVVLGDEARLRQVAANLLGNAQAHTPAGTPVQVTVTAAGGRARLVVADEGPGVDPALAERVFERFFRADPARTRTTGGAGLGLAIVAAVVAAHGGTTRLEPGIPGARFVVELPLAAATPGAPATPAAPPAPPASAAPAAPPTDTETHPPYGAFDG